MPRAFESLRNLLFKKKNLLQVRLTQKKFVASKKNERN
jgi:hypothetical protein